MMTGQTATAFLDSQVLARTCKFAYSRIKSLLREPWVIFPALFCGRQVAELLMTYPKTRGHKAHGFLVVDGLSLWITHRKARPYPCLSTGFSAILDTQASSLRLKLQKGPRRNYRRNRAPQTLFLSLRPQHTYCSAMTVFQIQDYFSLRACPSFQ